MYILSFLLTRLIEKIIQKKKVGETQTKLIEVQPTFKEDLLAGVEKFHVDTEAFYEDYENKFLNFCFR